MRFGFEFQIGLRQGQANIIYLLEKAVQENPKMTIKDFLEDRKRKKEIFEERIQCEVSEWEARWDSEEWVVPTEKIYIRDCKNTVNVNIVNFAEDLVAEDMVNKV